METDIIYNEDCAKGMSRIEDNSIDMVLTSPPYDTLRAYQGNDCFDFEEVATQIYRILKPGGITVWIVGDKTVNGSETGTSFRQALGFLNAGFLLHDTMIYQKNTTSFPESNRYYQAFEYMFVLSKGKPKTVHLIRDRRNRYPGTVCKGRERQQDGSLLVRRGVVKKNRVPSFGVRYNIWAYSVGYMHSTCDKIAFRHPAIFPEALAYDHIVSWSNEGDIVLDPFLGSGTTAKEAILAKRHFIGFEISKEYCDIASERIAKAKAEKESRLAFE